MKFVVFMVRIVEFWVWRFVFKKFGEFLYFKVEDDCYGYGRRRK